MIRHVLIPLALVGLAAPGDAAPPALTETGATALQQEVEAILATAPKGTRFGLLVADENGREIVALNPDQRFIPASTTKLFTTAAAYALLPGMDQPDTSGGTQVWLEPASHKGSKAGPDAVLFGRGDARLSSAADCTVNCLASLADAVARSTRQVHDVVGDASFWPDQRWAPGMSWNNIGTDSGTAVAALNLDDNELRLSVSPTVEGQAPTVQVPRYFSLRNEAVTASPGSKTQLFVERSVNGAELRLYGSIPVGGAVWTDRIGLDDPAHYAAWALKHMLEARGVKVTGEVRVRHRAPTMLDQVVNELLVPPSVVPRRPTPLASLAPPPLSQDVVVINKVSQNLHAQALFRRLGGATPSEQSASAVQREVLEQAGIDPRGFEFWDGAGMSTYNRLSPRAAIALLRWGRGQPWGAQWFASMPLAGREGTLRRRFVGTALEGNLAAKTGGLNATNALVGTFVSAKGQRLYFALFANDVPGGTSALPAMDGVLVRISTRN